MFQLGCLRDEYFVQKWSCKVPQFGGFLRRPHVVCGSFLISFGNGISFRAASPSKLRKYSSRKVILGASS